MYDRKTTAQFFDTINDIVQSLSLAKSFLECFDFQIGHKHDDFLMKCYAYNFVMRPIRRKPLKFAEIIVGLP